MHRDGHVRIESHTTLHRRVMTSPRADSFLSPDFRNHVYLIPPNMSMALTDGKLAVTSTPELPDSSSR